MAGKMLRKTSDTKSVLPFKFQSEFLAKSELVSICTGMCVKCSLLNVHKYNESDYLKAELCKLIFITQCYFFKAE